MAVNRKDLVKAIGEILSVTPNYLGAPSFAYEIGEFKVDRNGEISQDPLSDSGLMSELKRELSKIGFEMGGTVDGITIEYSLDGFSEQALENLHKLIAGKESLIKNAIGAESLPVLQTETGLKFPWFPLANGEEVEAYNYFIQGLCKLAKMRKRVTVKDGPVPNEKFAFRVFLIQLGFVGDKFKSARKILLKNLNGNSAFRDGVPNLNVAEVPSDE